MTLDSAVYIRHAAVGYLQGIPVEYFSEVVSGWEVFTRTCMKRYVEWISV